MDGKAVLPYRAKAGRAAGCLETQGDSSHLLRGVLRVVSGPELDNRAQRNGNESVRRPPDVRDPLGEMVPTWRGLWRQRRRWSRGLGRTVREQFAGAVRSGATHVPVCLLTMLGIGWLWASLAIGAIRLAVAGIAVARGQHVSAPGVYSHLLVYAGICFGFFFFQVVVATLLDRSRWRLYPKLFLVAPLYPLYFWAVSLTTFVAGFPQGFFRRDRGQWRRTVRSAEIATDTAPPALR